MAGIVGGATGAIDVKNTVAQLIEVENTKRLDPIDVKITRKQAALTAITDLKSLAAELEAKLAFFEDGSQFSGTGGAATLSTAVKDLVTSFNALNTKMRLYGRINKGDAAHDTAKEVVLYGDAALTRLERVVRDGLEGGLTVASGGARIDFSALGVARKLDGSLKFDQVALTKSITDRGVLTDIAAGVKSTFRTSLSDAALYSGPFESRTLQLNSELYTLNKRYSDEQAKIADEQTRLLTKYSKLNSILGSLGSTSTFLTAQLKALSNNNN